MTAERVCPLGYDYLRKVRHALELFIQGDEVDMVSTLSNLDMAMRWYLDRAAASAGVVEVVERVMPEMVSRLMFETAKSMDRGADPEKAVRSIVTPLLAALRATPPGEVK